jgi:integrase/recombinase XerC
LELISAKEQFLEYLVVIKRASAHTVRNYELDIQAFANFVSKGLCTNKMLDSTGQGFRNVEICLGIDALNRQNLRKFVSHEALRNLSRKSLARRLSSLRSFCAFCCREKILASDPMETIESPKLDKRIPVFLTYAQVERFLQLPDISTVLGLRDRAIMELFYSSGIRVSELVGVNRKDIDHAEEMIVIRGKGKKERIIPVTPNALQWVSLYCHHPKRCCNGLNDHEPVFLNSRGGRLTGRSVDRMFKHYLVLSGFSDRITPHVIRHTIATHWLDGGMDLKTIQALLGHSSMATTTIYTAVSGTLKKKVIADLHPRS